MHWRDDVFIVFLCLFVCGAQAAHNGWHDADMKIVYHVPLLGSWEAALKGREIAFDATDEGFTLYDVASEQILQGYYFLPKVEEKYRRNPELRKPGVREFICETKQFSSQRLQRCLEKIEEALEGPKDIPTQRSLLCKKLTKNVAKAKMLQKGKAHKWSVVPLSAIRNVEFAERVCLVFRDECDALIGWPCRHDETLYSVAPSLLYLHHHSVVLTLPPVLNESIPEPEDLLSSRCCSRYNLGIVHFAPEGKRSAALINASEIKSSIKYPWDATMPLFEALKTEILHGYFLKRNSNAKVDVSVVRQPHARKAACGEREFTDMFFDILLKQVGSLLKNGAVTFQGGHEFWRGLQAEQCVCPKAQKFAWSTILQKDLPRKLEENRNIVLLLLQGEEAALQGRFVPKGRIIGDEIALSLFDILCAQKVKEFNKKKKKT